MEELNKGYEFTKAQIAELESLRAENEGLKKRNAGEWLDVAATMAENETLRARLAELEAHEQEPVAVGKERFCSLCMNSGYLPKAAIAPEPPDIKCPNGCRPKLYTPPVVSPDVEALEDALDVAELRMSGYRSNLHRVETEVRSLKTELEAAQKDAERYRWLRTNKFIWSDFEYIRDCGRVVGLEFQWFPTESKKPTTTDLDVAIDAAIEQASSCNELHEKGGAA